MTLTFEELSPWVKTQGRLRRNGAVLEMDASTAGFEFYFEGEGDVTLHARLFANYTTYLFLSVTVDGRLSRVKADALCHRTFVPRDIPLAAGLRRGVHHIEVYRQTEACSALLDADSLTLSGRMLPPPPPDRIAVEVVGDSISGGSSALWGSGEVEVTGQNDNPDAPDFQDGTRSYAYLAGKSLGADVRVTQTSGYGCVNGWNRDGRVNLQAMFPYTSYWRGHETEDDLYPFDPPAEIVVINLGVNDATAAEVNGMSDGDFEAGAENLVRMAREKNPGCRLVWCTGMMGVYYPDILRRVLGRNGGEAEGLYYLELPRGQSGGGGHPNVTEHASAAAVLRDFLLRHCLPRGYLDTFADRRELQASLTRAEARTGTGAALRDAMFWARCELAVGTSDASRLGLRRERLEAAMAR